MERFVKKFWKEEDGNTTIDWMVLTAGLVLLGAAIAVSIGGETENLADHSSGQIDAIEPATGV